ncbi:zinc finger protein 649-like isoform X2 [Alosa sapidissima]|uniref:zinc finger protein 649-like isoform X2 n=1 Tax=Alosa sapidissima TaxID=34773 RepID=UPI001C093A4B|nr:zinc finger protein 649-like isoform X2 [Alosa sapidissima]
MDLGLPLSSSDGNVTETHQFGLKVVVKEEDIKEEEYGHMIACPNEEEKPFAELHCKTETDIAEPNVTNTETLQTTTVKIEVKKEEDEHDYQLENVSEHPHVTQQKIHGLNDELNLQLRGRLHHCTVCRKSFSALSELEKHQQTHSVSVNEQQNSDDKRRHECAQCGKAFLKVSNLKTHILIHTGTKPHKCIQCGKAFAQIHNLKPTC